jgi:succinate dehydrogenase / fumarate reductase, cytochrome b subunit
MQRADEHQRGAPRLPSAESSLAGGVRASQGNRSGFLGSRLASVLAVVPLGVWTFAHIWQNLAAFEGADAWQAAVTEYPHPFAEGATAIVVLFPLALHTIWGLSRLATSRPNNPRYPFYGNLKYLLQRASAVGVLLFLGAHLWLALIRPRIVSGHAEPFADITHEMHYHWPTLVTYLLGTLGTSYHLANGVQTFCMTWGVISSRRALQRLDPIAIGIFVLLLAMSWSAIYALWAAGEAAS